MKKVQFLGYIVLAEEIKIEKKKKKLVKKWSKQKFI